MLDPTTNQPSCNQVIEVISASGRTCGRSTFDCGGTSIGYDGTVIQSVTPTRLYNTDEFDCRWEWWPGFFH